MTDGTVMSFDPVRGELYVSRFEGNSLSAIRVRCLCESLLVVHEATNLCDKRVSQVFDCSNLIIGKPMKWRGGRV